MRELWGVARERDESIERTFKWDREREDTGLEIIHREIVDRAIARKWNTIKGKLLPIRWGTVTPLESKVQLVDCQTHWSSISVEKVRAMRSAECNERGREVVRQRKAWQWGSTISHKMPLRFNASKWTRAPSSLLLTVTVIWMYHCIPFRRCILHRRSYGHLICPCMDLSRPTGYNEGSWFRICSPASSGA